MTSWRLLQLADSAFPAGGFAHSGGLEAAMQIGAVRGADDLGAWLEAASWQAGLGALPFVGAAHDDPDRWHALDLDHDTRLTSHVANRASRTQGRAFVGACARIFDAPRIAEMHAHARDRRTPSHLAPAFGAIARAIELPRADTLQAFLYGSVRGAVSAAVRLGLVGPHEAQRMQDALAPTLDAVLGACATIGPDDAAQPSPLLELYGMSHDRLYARLFQS